MSAGDCRTDWRRSIAVTISPADMPRSGRRCSCNNLLGLAPSRRREGEARTVRLEIYGGVLDGLPDLGLDPLPPLGGGGPPLVLRLDQTRRSVYMDSAQVNYSFCCGRDRSHGAVPVAFCGSTGAARISRGGLAIASGFSRTALLGLSVAGGTDCRHE